MATSATTRLPVHLPPQPTRLIGREDDLAFLRSLLTQDDVRLLSLIGPGGVGKTRLAIAAAEQAQECFPMGSGSSIWRRWPIPLWWCRRSPAYWGCASAHAESPRSAVDVPRGAVGLAGGGQPGASAGCRRGPRRPAGESPNLTILATSREPLRLRREHLFEVHSLPVPGPEQAAWTVGNLAATPAVQLFVMRPRPWTPSFELSPANAKAVAELSRRLEGLPLAVELAAARIRLFEPKALLARMHQSLSLLRWDAPDLPPRHRSLHATLDWSYALLTAHQQALFRRLVIFVGGFTLEGAEAGFTGVVPGADDGQVTGSFTGMRSRRPAPRRRWTTWRRWSITASCGRSAQSGRSRATGYWRRCASSGRSNWRRAARKARSGGGTWSTSWRWPSTFRAPLAARRRAGLGPAGHRARQRASGA